MKYFAVFLPYIARGMQGEINFRYILVKNGNKSILNVDIY